MPISARWKMKVASLCKIFLGAQQPLRSAYTHVEDVYYSYSMKGIRKMGTKESRVYTPTEITTWSPRHSLTQHPPPPLLLFIHRRRGKKGNKWSSEPRLRCGRKWPHRAMLRITKYAVYCNQHEVSKRSGCLRTQPKCSAPPATVPNSRLCRTWK